MENLLFLEFLFFFNYVFKGNFVFVFNVHRAACWISALRCDAIKSGSSNDYYCNTSIEVSTKISANTKQNKLKHPLVILKMVNVISGRMKSAIGHIS